MTRLRNATSVTFRSLRHRNFRLYFQSQAISNSGTWLQLVAQTLLVYKLTDSGTAVGLLAAIQFLPTLLLGAWAGVVVDRHDKRRLMTLTGAVMMLAALALGVLALTDHVTVRWVYVLATVLGLANTFDNPGRRVLVNDMVPPEDLTNAVSLNSTLVTSARIIGPAIAGLLVTTVGIGWCFIINGVTFIAPVVALWMMDADVFRATPLVTRAKGQLRQGLRYVWSVDELRIPLLLMAVIGTLSFNYHVVLPLFGERNLHGGDGTFTLLFTTFGIGSLVGSLRLARRPVVDTRFVARSAVSLGLSSIVLAISPSVFLACPALLVAGHAAIGIQSGGNAVLQLHASPEMRGRVLALFTVVFIGSTPIGGPIAGWVAERFGAPVGIGLGAVAAVAGGAVVLAALRRGTGGVVLVPHVEAAT